LYRSLRGDTRAEQNLEALERGSLAPPVSLTGSDLLEAYTVERWSNRLGWLAAPGRVFHAAYEWTDFVSPVACVTALAGLLLAIAFARARPSPSASATPSGRTAWLPRQLVPGLADLWSSHVWRGYATLVLFLFPTLVLAIEVASLAAAPGLGPLTSFESFEVLKVHVVPSSSLADGTASAAARGWVLLSHPHAVAFLGLAAAAALTSLTLHVWRLRELARNPDLG
jgi:hypothetical protein